MFESNRWRRITYTLWAPGYDLVVGRLFDRQRQRAAQLLNAGPGERVLIVGAGTGLDLPYLSASGARLIAIDLTPAMLQRLRRRGRQLDPPVEAIVMNAEMLAFADASFDAAVLNLILAVTQNPILCLRETARVLRPGGRAVIFDKFEPDRGAWLARALSPAASLVATTMNRRLAPMLAGSGLRVRSEEPGGWRGFYRIAVVEKSS